MKEFDQATSYAERPQLERVCNEWTKTGHQTNLCRMEIVKALQCENMTKAEMSRHIRQEIYSTSQEPWDGVANGDSIYNSIYCTVRRVEKDWKEGKLKNLVDSNCDSDLKSKTVTPGARGKKAGDESNKSKKTNNLKTGTVTPRIRRRKDINEKKKLKRNLSNTHEEAHAKTTEQASDRLQFIICSLNKNSFVMSLPTHTLSDVRQLIHEEWDDDQYPSHFKFEVNKVLYSTKQEVMLTVGQIFEKGWEVQLVGRPELEYAARPQSSEIGEKREFSLTSHREASDAFTKREDDKRTTKQPKTNIDDMQEVPVLT